VLAVLGPIGETWGWAPGLGAPIPSILTGPGGGDPCWVCWGASRVGSHHHLQGGNRTPLIGTVFWTEPKKNTHRSVALSFQEPGGGGKYNIGSSSCISCFPLSHFLDCLTGGGRVDSSEATLGL